MSSTYWYVSAHRPRNSLSTAVMSLPAFGLCLFSPQIYNALKVYWFDNPSVLMAETTKLLDEIEVGVKALEVHEKAACIGRKIGEGDRLAYATSDKLSQRLDR